MPANSKMILPGQLTRYLRLVVLAGLVYETVSCGHASEGRCLRGISRKAAVRPDILPDSAAAVNLALQGARCAGYEGDSLIVKGFERDTASLLIQFGPPPTRGGGGPLIRVARGGAVAVLERYQ